ncbi:MAG: hypothetical protein WD708_03975 [Kiritimatiellia bacterium]
MRAEWDPVSLETLSRVKDWVEEQVRCHDGPFILGVGGPGGSGKSRVAEWLRVHVADLVVLGLDDFRLPRKNRPKHAPFGSHPDAIDWDRLEDVLRDVKAGGPVRQPVFDRLTGSATKENLLPGGDVILLDGEITSHERMFPYLDKRIVVRAHLWTQLRTRLNRDRRERWTSLKKTLRIFYRSNLCDYPRFASKSAPDVSLYRKSNHQLYIEES